MPLRVQDEDEDWRRSPTQRDLAQVPVGELGLVDAAASLDRLQYDVQAHMRVHIKGARYWRGLG